MVHVDVGDPVAANAVAGLPEQAQRRTPGLGKQVVALQTQAVVGGCSSNGSWMFPLENARTQRQDVERSQMGVYCRLNQER